MYTLPELAYGYADLEPVISREIMELHHSKHHATYVQKLNEAIADQPELQNMSIQNLLKTLMASDDSALQRAVRNNGGGHLNHSFFWQVMTPGGSTLHTEGDLYGALVARYGSIDAFQQEFTAAALGLFGSGWVWLTPDLRIVTTPNQDNPIMNGQPMPILGLDVWEHAYYLDYKNVRADYCKNWWKVVHWQQVELNHKSAQ